MVSLSNLRAVWMVLNDLTGELEREGVELSGYIHAELRNSKMVLEYLNSFEEEIRAGEGGDTRLRLEIEKKILIFKDSLLIHADENLGEVFRKTWESKIDDALEGKIREMIEDSKTSISDIPRDKDTAFFRIKLPDNIPIEVVSEMAESCRVNISLDGERHLQVSGKRDCVRNAMKKLGELFYGRNILD